MSSLRKIINKIYYKRYIRLKILNYYRRRSDITPEQQEVMQFLSSNPCHTFPYHFTRNYTTKGIKVYTDESSQLKYVLTEQGRRLYFKRGSSDSSIKRGIKNLRLEQDKLSPHCYLTPDFDVSQDDIVADIGCADGNFGLMVVDRVKHLYLFEVELEWTEALRKTFEPWRDKVTIVNKFVSQSNDQQNVSIDEFTKTNPITFIKGDLEGFEEVVLKGGTQFLSSNTSLKVVITTYHAQNHGDMLWKMLSDCGFSCKYSRGYMILKNLWNLEPPYLRRGLIYATKQKKSV